MEKFITKYIDKVFDIGTKVFMVIVTVCLLVLTIRNLFF